MTGKEYWEQYEKDFYGRKLTGEESEKEILETVKECEYLFRRDVLYIYQGKPCEPLDAINKRINFYCHYDDNEGYGMMPIINPDVNHASLLAQLVKYHNQLMNLARKWAEEAQKTANEGD